MMPYAAWKPGQCSASISVNRRAWPVASTTTRAVISQPPWHVSVVSVRPWW